MSTDKLPWGWQQPTRASQQDLFPRTRDDLLALARVSMDELAQWRAKGWISFEASDCETLDEALFQEVVFIRNLARSGLSDAQIGELLRGLEPPYRYDPTRAAYSFALGWVQIPVMPEAGEVDAFIREHISKWIFDSAIREEFILLEDGRSRSATGARARCPCGVASLGGPGWPSVRPRVGFLG